MDGKATLCREVMTMTFSSAIRCLPLLLPMLVGCAEDEDENGDASPAGPPPSASEENARFAIEGLSDGAHGGIVIGFEPLDGDGIDRAARADVLIAEARDAGTSVARVQADWAELEPAPGRYDETALRSLLADAVPNDEGLLFTLSTLDTGTLTIPADLMDGVGPRPGLRLADPEVGNRFAAFLDWLVPLLLVEDVWALSLANEGETLIADGVVSSEDAVAFLVGGLERVRGIAPGLATGVTLTSDAPRSFAGYSEPILDASEVAIFNFYCLDETLVTTRSPRWDSDLDAMLGAAGALPVVFQELGCPTGYDNGSGDLEGGESVQAGFFEHVGERAVSTAQIRALFAFQLFDWSPGLSAAFAEPLRAEGATVAADRLEEWLATVGLCRWSDATCTPAWNVWLNVQRRFAEERPAAIDPRR